MSMQEESRWFVGVVVFLATLIFARFKMRGSSKSNLPPGPPTFPIIGNLLWLRKSYSELEDVVRGLHAQYGPIISLPIGFTPAIFVSSNSLAYEALVQNGAVFADRPPLPSTAKIMIANRRTVSSAPYGPAWRLLRRNLTSEILHSSRVKLYSHARNWALNNLVAGLRQQAQQRDGMVSVMKHFHFAMFCLLVRMCFGDHLGEAKIREIEAMEIGVLQSSEKFKILNFFPVAVGKFLFRKRWEEFLQLRKDHEDVLVPLIRARRSLQKTASKPNNPTITCYVDTLLDLQQLPDEKRKLTEGEMVSLCSEFLNAGTHTTEAPLQWIMANLVKYPQIQAKLWEEMRGVVGEGEEEVKEEDLERMPYLKAVVLEGLRRHTPAHFLVPHGVTEEVRLDGYVIPKDAKVFFMAAEMASNPEVWVEPMEFKPERFIKRREGGAGCNNGETIFDITGSREIKMMPFGAGRRICPGYGLGMLHLEYFVANLVWKFEWKGVDGVGVDLSETLFSLLPTTMKNPLQARIAPRT